MQVAYLAQITPAARCPCSFWWEGIFIPNLSEDNETRLQRRATPTEMQSHLFLLFDNSYQEKPGVMLLEVQLEQQFDRPNFVCPQIYHLDR